MTKYCPMWNTLWDIFDVGEETQMWDVWTLYSWDNHTCEQFPQENYAEGIFSIVITTYRNRVNMPHQYTYF